MYVPAALPLDKNPVMLCFFGVAFSCVFAFDFALLYGGFGGKFKD